MPGETCRTCGGPLPQRAGGPGRSSVYCSAACRQRAYRARQGPRPEPGVEDLIADIGRRVRELSPRPPGPFYEDVADLSSSVGRLRRIARVARDAARSGQSKDAKVTKPTGDIVTPGLVTQLDGEPEAQAVRSGDEAEFAAAIEPHRRELQVHCYRMVGSYDDAEDLVQETLLRAWRARRDFAGRSSLRAWLYRIATNASLDFLRKNTRRPGRYDQLPGMNHGDAEPPSRVTWLQPYPDELLQDVASSEAGPDAAIVSRETMELVLLAAIQHLPPRQRAVLILRDVLGQPAAETAEMLDMTVASVNSALQRARPAIREHMPRRRMDWAAPAEPSREEREILRRYMEVSERADTSAMAEMLSRDVKLTMPPNPFWFIGRDALLEFVTPSFDPASPQYFGRWRHLPARANRQPAAAGYVQRPGTTVYRAQTLDVLRIEDGEIVEITTFEPHLLPAFGLPLTL